MRDDATASWYDKAPPERRGRPLRYTDTAITTALMLKMFFIKCE
ncbi:transposase [Pectobacterium odoriferum]|nr:transposase [Pectobacterium odoriferum]